MCIQRSHQYAGTQATCHCRIKLRFIFRLPVGDVSNYLLCLLYFSIYLILCLANFKIFLCILIFVCIFTKNEQKIPFYACFFDFFICFKFSFINLIIYFFFQFQLPVLEALLLKINFHLCYFVFSLKL